jgi:hypothetical protein
MPADRGEAIDQATASLKKAKVLMPFPIQVLNK